MVNANFMKEVIPNIQDNNILIIINPAQFKESIKLLLTELINKKEKTIFITFTEPAENIIQKFPSENLFVIDAFSNDKREEQNFISLKNFNDLVQIQIAIKKAIQKIGKNATIIFDSMNTLSIYNSSKEIGKFIHIFSNKMKLSENNCIFIITKSSIDSEILDYAKQFCDQTFDFTQIATYTIENKK